MGNERNIKMTISQVEGVRGADYVLGELYPQVLYPAPCHKVAAMIFQDVQMAILGEVKYEANSDLLTLLHNIASVLDHIPEIIKATDQRLRFQLAVEKANETTPLIPKEEDV